MGKIFIMDDVIASTGYIKAYMESLRGMMAGISSAVNDFVDSSLESAAYNALKDYYTGTFLELITVINNSYDSIVSDCDDYVNAMETMSDGDRVLKEDDIVSRIAYYQELENTFNAKIQRIKNLMNSVNSENYSFMWEPEDLQPTEAEYKASDNKRIWQGKLEKLKALDEYSANCLVAAQSEVSNMLALLNMNMMSLDVAINEEV